MSYISFLSLVLLSCPQGDGLIMQLVNSDGSVDLHELVNHLDVLEQMVLTQQTKMDDLEFQVDILTGDINRTRTDLEKTRSGKETTDKELTSAKQELSAIKVELGMTSNEAIAAKSDVEKLQAELLSLKVNLNSSSPDQMGHDVSSNSANIHQLQQDVHSSHEVLLNNSRLLSNMETNMAAVQSDLNTATEDIRDLESNVSSINCSSRKVSFRACISAYAYYNSTISFDDIGSNTGHGYNSTTGKFTAPVSGTYLFSVHASMYCPEVYVHTGHLSLMKTGTVLSQEYIKIIKADGYKSTSFVSVPHLDKGEEVWAETDSLYLLGLKNTCFIGYLLSVD